MVKLYNTVNIDLIIVPILISVNAFYHISFSSCKQVAGVPVYAVADADDSVVNAAPDIQ
jgi:hypothetical protein